MPIDYLDENQYSFAGVTGWHSSREGPITRGETGVDHLNERKWTNGWSFDELSRCNALDFAESKPASLENDVHPILAFEKWNAVKLPEPKTSDLPDGVRFSWPADPAYISRSEWAVMRPALQLVTRWLTDPSYTDIWGLLIFGETNWSALRIDICFPDDPKKRAKLFPNLTEHVQSMLTKIGEDEGSPIKFQLQTGRRFYNGGIVEGKDTAKYGGNKSIARIHRELLNYVRDAMENEPVEVQLRALLHLSVVILDQLADALFVLFAEREERRPLKNDPIFIGLSMPLISWSVQHLLFGYVLSYGGGPKVHQPFVATNLMAGVLRRMITGGAAIADDDDLDYALPMGNSKTTTSYYWPVSMSHISNLFQEEWWEEESKIYGHETCKVSVDNDLLCKAYDDLPLPKRFGGPAWEMNDIGAFKLEDYTTKIPISKQVKQEPPFWLGEHARV